MWIIPQTDIYIDSSDFFCFAKIQVYHKSNCIANYRAPAVLCFTSKASSGSDINDASELILALGSLLRKLSTRAQLTTVSLARPVFQSFMYTVPIGNTDPHQFWHHYGLLIYSKACWILSDHHTQERVPASIKDRSQVSPQVNKTWTSNLQHILATSV